MKILTLYFKNLNSLQGEWQIDFQHPAYINEGIFAITGATGAGKSTILDAICLALYGATPRLGDITHNKNDIMSRHTSECFSEVTFETQSGVYRCHWGQKRAKKSPTGKLQSPKHEISKQQDNQQEFILIEEQAKKTKVLVENITGMDFQRFTRAMLLAQGSFSAFLQASSTERSELLEQITGTEIYSEISIKVHEMKKNAELELKSLTDKLSGIQLLSFDEKQQLETQQQQLENQQILMRKQLEQLEISKIWRQNLDNTQQKSIEYQQQQQQLLQQIQQFAPKQQQLQQALIALELASDYQLLKQHRQQLTENHHQQQTLIQQRPQILQKINEYQQDSENKQRFFQQQEIAWQQLQPVLKNVREKDIHLQQLQAQIEQHQQQLSNYQHKITENQNLQQQQQQNLQQYQQESQLLQTKQQNPVIHQLPQILTNIEHWQKQFIDLESEYQTSQQKQMNVQQQQQINQQKSLELQQQVDSFRQTIHDNSIKFDNLQQQWQALTDNQPRHLLSQQKDTLWENQYLFTNIQQQLKLWQNQQIEQTHIQQKYSDIQQQQQVSQQNYDNLLQQQQQLKTKIQLLTENLLLLSKIANLEQERQHLTTGKPCPLCGATEHPFAHHSPILPNINQQELDNTHQQLENIQQQLQDCLLTKNSLEKDQQQLFNHHQQISQSQVEISQQIFHHCQQLLNHTTNWQTFFNPYQQILPENFQSFSHFIQQHHQTVADNFQQLQQRLQTIDNIEQQRQQLQYDISQIQQQSQTIEQELINIQNQLHYQQEQLQQNQQILIKLTEKRQLMLQELQTLFEPYQDFVTQPLSWQTLDNIEKSRLLLQQVWQDWQEQQLRLQQLQTFIQQQQQQLLTLQSELQNFQQNYQQQFNLLTELQHKFQQLSTERWQLFADKNTDNEENLSNLAKQTAYHDWQTAWQYWQNSQQQLIDIDSRLDTFYQQEQQWQSNIDELSQNLSIKFQNLGFVDEIGYLSACLSEHDRQTLQQQSNALQQQQQTLTEKIAENQQLQQQYEQQAIIDEFRDLSLVAIGEKLDVLQQQFNQNQENLGSIRQQLTNYTSVQQHQQKLLKSIEKQRDIFQQWHNLYQLIGSSDGKKFRNFAQGLTFNVMIAHANEQLQKMTDRYLLLADSEQILMLNVVDNYQGGEVRTSKNLSGGESFIISLALALGLSNMASHRMQVNSLFLDEGFGTLDDDALDVALNTLTTLQQSGKMIGVISHIHALKERISSQIQIVPKSGGISQIVGLGVTKIR